MYLGKYYIAIVKFSQCIDLGKLNNTVLLSSGCVKKLQIGGAKL